MPGRLRETLLAAAIAAALAGCGSDEDGTIPPADAESLLAQLDAVEESIADGECDEAQIRAQDLTDLVNELPAEVGTETKEALREASDNLVGLAAEQCEPTGATGEDGVEPTTETEEPTTETTTTTTEETTTDEDEPEEEEEEQEPPEEEQEPPEEEPPPSDDDPGGGPGGGGGGGQPPSGGLGPGGGGEGR
ncbi:MAG: hypothetical protein ACRDK9_09025 [Solirubrobacterales bacterium]